MDKNKWYKIRVFLGLQENDFDLMRLLGDDGVLIDGENCSLHPHKSIHTVGKSIRAYLDGIRLPDESDMQQTYSEVRREHGSADSPYWEAYYRYEIISPGSGRKDQIDFVVMFGIRTERIAKSLKTKLDKHLRKNYAG